VLGFAVILLGLTVLLGAALIIVALQRRDAKPPIWLASLHGCCALLGYGALLWALRGPARGAATGTQSFGPAASVLLLVAAALGIASLALHFRRRRFPGFWAGAHASVAIFGYVILAVYLLLG
jgi:hypothetical protein